MIRGRNGDVDTRTGSRGRRRGGRSSSACSSRSPTAPGRRASTFGIAPAHRSGRSWRSSLPSRTLLPALHTALNIPVKLAWTIGAVGAAYLVFWWVLFVLPSISLNVAFLVTLGVAAGGGGRVDEPGQPVPRQVHGVVTGEHGHGSPALWVAIAATVLSLGLPLVGDLPGRATVRVLLVGAIVLPSLSPGRPSAAITVGALGLLGWSSAPSLRLASCCWRSPSQPVGARRPATTAEGSPPPLRRRCVSTWVGRSRWRPSVVRRSGPGVRAALSRSLREKVDRSPISRLQS